MTSVRRSNKRIASPSSPESSFSLAHPQRQTPPRQNSRRLPVLSSIAAPRTRSNRRRQRKQEENPAPHTGLRLPVRYSSSFFVHETRDRQGPNATAFLCTNRLIVRHQCSSTPICLLLPYKLPQGFASFHVDEAPISFPLIFQITSRLRTFPVRRPAVCIFRLL